LIPRHTPHVKAAITRPVTRSVSAVFGRLATVVVSAVVALVVGGSVVPVHASGRAEATQQGIQPQAVTVFYRLYNPRTGDHFHTSGWEEVIAAISNDGYKYEGIGANVFSTQEPGTVPFYRLFHPGTGDHFHTTNWQEVLTATLNDGYSYEGVHAYVYPGGSGQGIPFYRLHHPGTRDHYHTTNWAEVVAATSNDGYKYEGIGANVG
jgi:hypothetical protein